MTKRHSYLIVALALLVGIPLVASVSTAGRPLASGGAEMPNVVRAVAPPDYPALAAQAHVGGVVTVEVTIDRAGAVTGAKLIEVSGPTRIFKDEWYERLAREWRFAADEGAPHARNARIQFAFRLMPRGTPREQLGTVFAPPYQVEVREEEPERVRLPGQ